MKSAPLFLFLIIALTVVGWSVPVVSHAFFSSLQDSQTNQFVAGSIELMSLFDESVVVTPLVPLTNETIVISTLSPGLPALTDMVVTNFSGDVTLCNALEFTTTNADNLTVTAPVSGYQSAVSTTGGNWQWSVGVNNLPNVTHGASCVLTLTVTAWQASMTKATAGFFDTKSFTITVTVAQVLLNEILVNPDSTLGEREFVEVINHSNQAVDIAGWNISERTTTGAVTNHFVSGASTGAAVDMIALDGSLNTLVPAGGHLALRYRGNRSYLNSTGGDIVTLIEVPTGRVLDEYAWTTNVAKASTFSRLPDGIGAWGLGKLTPNAVNQPLASSMNFAVLAREGELLVASSSVEEEPLLVLSDDQNIVDDLSVIDNDVSTAEEDVSTTEAEFVDEGELDSTQSNVDVAVESSDPDLANSSFSASETEEEIISSPAPDSESSDSESGDSTGGEANDVGDTNEIDV